MAGSGKSMVADFLVGRGYGYLRFGQITLDIVKQRGLEPTEQNEKQIRIGVRKQYGMGAYATLNIPKFDALLEKGNVVGDGLYSWSEYKILKTRYGPRFVVIAVYAPPRIRYERLSKRTLAPSDTDLRHRPMAPEQAQARDYAELEEMEKGAPIAMADFTLLNLSTPEELFSELEKAIRVIEQG
jgi:dephospho-CoA kinase